MIPLKAQLQLWSDVPRAFKTSMEVDLDVWVET